MREVPATVREIMRDLKSDPERKQRVYEAVRRFEAINGHPMQFREDIYRILQSRYDGYSSKHQCSTSKVCRMICVLHSKEATHKFDTTSPPWVLAHAHEVIANPWTQPTGEFQTIKEPTMAITATNIFEVRTFIGGENAANISNEAIFSVISEAEARIDKLSKIEHKPKALKDEIEALNIGLQNIITYVDERS